MVRTRDAVSQFKFIGGALCLDFANTGDLLRDYDDLIAWLRLAGALDEGEAAQLLRTAGANPDGAAAAFRRVAFLRRTIRRIFSSSAHGHPPAAADLVRLSATVGRSAKNQVLRASREGFRWNWRGVEERLDWPEWIIARSAAELLTSDRQGSVRSCAARDCDWLFVDASRNHSRRWCDMAECGNRAKARRSYSRKRALSRPRRPA